LRLDFKYTYSEVLARYAPGEMCELLGDCTGLRKLNIGVLGWYGTVDKGVWKSLGMSPLRKVRIGGEVRGDVDLDLKIRQWRHKWTRWGTIFEGGWGGEGLEEKEKEPGQVRNGWISEQLFAASELEEVEATLKVEMLEAPKVKKVKKAVGPGGAEVGAKKKVVGWVMRSRSGEARVSGDNKMRKATTEEAK
jgi:hypothetical protein